MPDDRYMPAEDARHSAAELRLVKFNEGKRIKKPRLWVKVTLTSPTSAKADMWEPVTPMSSLNCF